jgi:cellulose synthase/poly-beta-1,6-N-acetylglucosamine synthase-like glycosyltransferase
MKLLFFLSLAMLFYIYVGYFLLIMLLGAIRRKPVRQADFEPTVTILVPAFNEEAHIEATLKNKLSLDYPPAKLEIIVISDGSTDRTDAIVQGIDHPQVRLIRQDSRAGKTAALEKAVVQASGEIIVFSDANSIYAKDALRKLVRNFYDPEVGYVTGNMVYGNSDHSTIGESCSSYMRYENSLRIFETRIGSIVGVDGGIDAIRKRLYRPMRPDQLPDFILPLKVVDQGFRVVYEPEAILREAALASLTDEYKMRVRVALRALWALFDMRHLLRPHQYGIFSIQLFSHKILRYAGFFFLISAWTSNIFLLKEGLFYAVFFIAQNIAYLGAIISPTLERHHVRFRLLYYCHYFALLNLSSAHAFVKFLLKEKRVIWTPRKG